MISVLVADDHQLVIDGIRLMLEDQPDMQCVGQAHNGEEVLRQLPFMHVDVVLMDINMPKLNGIETTKRIRKDWPEIQVLALSMQEENSLIRLMLKNGAIGYLLKNTGERELLKAIRLASQGQPYYSEQVQRLVFGDSKRRSRTQESPFPALSRREKQVLDLIVNERTTGEIAEQLFIGFGTVETHRRNLLLKLGARNTAGLVRVAMEYGLLDP